MLPILQLGPLAIPLGPFLILASVWLGLSLAEREAARLKLNPDRISSLAMTGILAGLIGARLAYVLRHLDAFAGDPLAIIWPDEETLSALEGIGIGVIAMLVYGARKRLPLKPVLDSFAGAVAVLLAGVAASHLATGDAFGAPARLPWSIWLWGDYRHPSQVYELIAALAVLGVWWKARTHLPEGTALAWVAGLSALATVLLEAFRGDSTLTVAGLRTAQVVALAVLLVCLGVMKQWNRPVDRHGDTESQSD